ncbi:MAG: secondary thiamine-phosphate synthase enzyme YjbQ [Polyangiaceae bacterium]
MKAHPSVLQIETRPRAFVDVTKLVEDAVRKSGVKNGICAIFLRHTSASIVIQENADPAVLRDLQKWMSKIAPESDVYEHDAEGDDDMPAHLRTAVTKSSESIPIIDGRLALGTWQAIYIWEHRAHAHTRELVVQILGE